MNASTTWRTFPIVLGALALCAGTAAGQPLLPPKPAVPAGQQHVAAEASRHAVSVGDVRISAGKIDSLATLMARARGTEARELSTEQLDLMRQLITTNLIGQELLELEAKATGIQASPREIDSAMRDLRAQFPDEAAWQRAMRQSGESEAQVRAKLARQIRADKVLEANMQLSGAPSEAEMRAFWEENKDAFPVNDSLRAIQILLRAGATTSEQQVSSLQSRLENIRRVVLGEDSTDTPALLRRFMAEAARHGEGPEARQGGDLERFHPADFHPDFRKHVTGLQVGQVSPVFRTPLGFHLVLLIEKYDGKFESYRLQSLQNLMAQRNLRLGMEMREFLKKLASKYPVTFHLPNYRDVSESGLY